MRLSEKVAIVTGGAAGIGSHFCRCLAAEGARVVIADIDGDGAGRIEAALRERGREAMAVRTDVSVVEAVEGMVRDTLERYGRIDILVNNAAVYQRVRAAKLPVWELSPEEWNRIVSVNLTGVFLCCRAVLPQMIRQGAGKVINISSAHALAGTANFAHYVACKGGILSLTKALAREAGQYGIQVNCLAPGSILSEEQETAEILKIREAAVAARAIKRIGYPGDLAGALLFLATADSDFVTGQTIVVDGGAVMH